MSFKTKLFVAMLLIAAIVAIAGCSKSNNNPGPDDKYSELFRGKTWCGEFKYASKPVTEPFNITFKEDGTLIWREYSGTYNGKYTVDKNAGTIMFGFNAAASQVSAKIAVEGKLTDFTFNQSDWKIIHSEINKAEIEQVIEGTTWKGSTTDKGGSSLLAQFDFLTNGQVHIPAGGTGFNFESTSYYSRESGTLRFEYDGTGGPVRITGRLFFVFMADSSLKGYEYKQVLGAGVNPDFSHKVLYISKQ
ncbi:hypothetical protein AB6805_16210 [Chitinophaga sp. RCC_12]|uniref:hypothetical protein n=1 Tax=Chitinophaga sp. RCC_12 TaxID=3239226 RepID=UPI003526695D